MTYLCGTLETVIDEASKRFKVVMISGMRQVGKSYCYSTKPVLIAGVSSLTAPVV
jgi:predicted AAA+ superfamily ATPase